MEKGIYRFSVDCDRMGELYGIFVEEKEYIKQILESKEEIYFNDVLGKHSEIAVVIEEHELTLVTDDPSAVEIFEKYELETGINPCYKYNF